MVISSFFANHFFKKNFQFFLGETRKVIWQKKQTATVFPINTCQPNFIFQMLVRMRPRTPKTRGQNIRVVQCSLVELGHDEKKGPLVTQNAVGRSTWRKHYTFVEQQPRRGGRVIWDGRVPQLCRSCRGCDRSRRQSDLHHRRWIVTKEAQGRESHEMLNFENEKFRRMPLSKKPEKKANSLSKFFFVYLHIFLALSGVLCVNCQKKTNDRMWHHKLQMMEFKSRLCTGGLLARWG